MPKEVNVSGGGGGGGAFNSAADTLYIDRYNGAGLSAGMYRWDATAMSAATDLANSDWYFFDIGGSVGDENFDNNPGWLNTTAYLDSVYWGATFPAYTVLKLPVGIYYWQMYVEFEAAVPPDGVIYGLMDWAESYFTLGGTLENSYYGGIGQSYLSYTPNDITAQPDNTQNSGVIFSEHADTYIVPCIRVTTSGVLGATHGVREFILTVAKVA